MSDFSTLEFKSQLIGGTRALVFFLKGIPESHRITYHTPLTDNVIGHLSEEEVSALLVKIEAL